jgi:anti-sigma-K factor RskA
MNIRDNEVLRDKLAAEYVLGTLRAGARRRFEGWLHHDAALRLLVAEWQQRLLPMAEFSAAQQPDQRVWRDIERRLHFRTGRQRWWDRLGLWRGLGLASTAVALALVVAVGVRQAQAPVIDHVATLTDDKAQPALLVTADSRHRTMEVKLVSDTPVPDDKTLELWAIPKQGAPRSLGIMAGRRVATLELNQRAIGDDVVLLAISLEPKGGSPNPNGPSGPVLYKGPWVRLL